MTVQAFPVDPQQVAVALSIEIDMPAVAYAVVDDEVLVGTGGLAWGKGRCWLWFTVIAEPKPVYGIVTALMGRKLKAKARQLGETTIYAVRDPEFETSSRLMKMTGFVLHGVEDGNEVFRCDL